MTEDTNPQLKPGVLPLTTPTPQIAQLELQYKGPLTTDSMVEKFDDLIKLNPKYHYEHKGVWVKEKRCRYYIDNGDGTEFGNWRKEIARVVMQRWDEFETYQQGDTIYLSGKVYNAIKDVPIGISPLIAEDYWLVVSGESETYRYVFINTSSVLIYTEIRNPKFEIIIGTFPKDESGNFIICSETGLIVIQDQERIDAHVLQREDLAHREGNMPENDGIAYEIRFIEDEKPVNLTGVINIK